jgi:hypothetical protein
MLTDLTSGPILLPLLTDHRHLPTDPQPMVLLLLHHLHQSLHMHLLQLQLMLLPQSMDQLMLSQQGKVDSDSEVSFVNV